MHFVLFGSLCVCLLLGPRRAIWALGCSCYSLVVLFSFPCKRLVDSKYSRMSKDLLKEFHHHFFICCSHPCLTRIRFQGSNGMDPRHACHYFISFFSREIFSFFYQKVFFFVVHQIYIFKQGRDKISTNVKEHFDNILTVHLGKVICASLWCCAIFADVPPAPLFISIMNLRTYPLILKISYRGSSTKRYASKVCDSINSTVH